MDKAAPDDDLLSAASRSSRRRRAATAIAGALLVGCVVVAVWPYEGDPNRGSFSNSTDHWARVFVALGGAAVALIATVVAGALWLQAARRVARNRPRGACPRCGHVADA